MSLKLELSSRQKLEDYEFCIWNLPFVPSPFLSHFIESCILHSLWQILIAQTITNFLGFSVLTQLLFCLGIHPPPWSWVTWGILSLPLAPGAKFWLIWDNHNSLSPARDWFVHNFCLWHNSNQYDIMGKFNWELQGKIEPSYSDTERDSAIFLWVLWCGIWSWPLELLQPSFYWVEDEANMQRKAKAKDDRKGVQLYMHVACLTSVLANFNWNFLLLAAFC